MNLRKRIDEKCKDCIYDPTAPGTWRQQVLLCSAKSCPLRGVRAKPTSPIPESTLRWNGVDLAEFQPLTADIEGGVKMDDLADCEIIGRDYALISEGEYEVVLESWETSSRFSRKDKDDPSVIKGGKLYLWFRVDPYNQALDSEVMLFMAMNVSNLVLPTGENGKFKVGARSKYYKTLKRLFGDKAAENARSPKSLKGKVLVARVRTVKSDDKQRKHSEEEWYSVIDELIELG